MTLHVYVQVHGPHGLTLDNTFRRSSQCDDPYDDRCGSLCGGPEKEDRLAYQILLLIS
jgi:hypothetical protein